MTFVEKSVDIFNQYYPKAFEKTKTLIIPTSNDLVNDYFYGKIDTNDHTSNYDAKQIKKNKDETKDTYIQLLNEGSRLLNEAANIVDKSKKEQMQQDGNQHIEVAELLKAEVEQSDQPWNKLKYSQMHRERESIMKLVVAFSQSDIGGILIQSPKQIELQNFITTESAKYASELNNFAEEFSKYPEICDCIYLHPILGIYLIEAKAANKLNTKAHKKAIKQLQQKLIATDEQSMNLMQKLYLLFAGSQKNIPPISGIVCMPNASSSNDQSSSPFHHFGSNILDSVDEFKQFWTHQLSIATVTANLFELPHYRSFTAAMAYCSVGRELFGINNALMIAKKITEHNIDPTMMKKRQYISVEGSQTIFLNAKQLQILNDTSKLKFIFGPPGTGKTLLVILAAIDAVKEENGKVIVITREWLVEYMKRIFKMNGFDQNTIEVRNRTDGIGELNVNDYILVDECSADEAVVQDSLNIAKQIRNVKLFVAISGQVNIDKLRSIEEQIMQLLNNENDYRIFQLTEILRGTKSIIDFWINRFNQILPKELQMECGHSIVGQNVDYYSQYLKSDEIMDKMVERLKDLLIKNEPKNIVIICGGSYEKGIIESRLKLVEIAFGSTIEQDNNHSLIAVELSNNILSREWPFVISVDLSSNYYRQMSIISSSRAIAHLTLIERNYKEIQRRIRDKCDDNMMKTILSSFVEYTQFRNQIQLSDDKVIMNADLYTDIISLNYFPSQIKQLYPNIFDDCNTFDQFFDIIVNKEQCMLLLFVHQWRYFQHSRHVDKSINLIIECKQSRNWFELYEIEEIRAECLINNAKNAIELINKLIQPEVQEIMDKVVTDNWQLFEVLINSNGIHQFDLMANSIRQIIWINCIYTHKTQKVKIDTTEIDYVISKLLLNLNCSVVYNTSAKVLQSLRLFGDISTITDVLNVD